jgi:4-diphosphocytidyl-2-C-methyl-D-erythritol kinase
MNSIIVKSNAKINLALFIKYKRVDGFHEIESIFQEIDFGDQLIISKADKIVFKTDSPVLKNQDNNLCIQAAQLLQKEYHIPGLAIDLKKQIPIGAGLGGGSSNSAAVLKAGIQLFKMKIEQEKIHLLASRLGSDVPFFLRGKTALIRGRGDNIQQVKWKGNYYIILVIPDLSISTTWAYKNLRLGLTKNESNLKFISLKFHKLDVGDFTHYFHNDFEKVVFKVYPHLEQIKNLLYKEGADYASLSGSGSTIFGIYRSKERAQKAIKLLSLSYTCVLTVPVLG